MPQVLIKLVVLTPHVLHDQALSWRLSCPLRPAPQSASHVAVSSQIVIASDCKVAQEEGVTGQGEPMNEQHALRVLSLSFSSTPAHNSWCIRGSQCSR